MNIELKKVKHSAALSEETDAFFAEVWVDGVMRGTAKNDGHGGANRYEPHALRQELNEYAKTLPKYRCASGLELDYDADLLVGEAFDRWQYTKDLKSKLSKRTIFIAGGKLYSCRLGANPKDAELILNNMSLDEAVKVYIRCIENMS